MKRRGSSLLGFVVALSLVNIAGAQPLRTPDGGGQKVLGQTGDCLSAVERQRIREKLDHSIAQLKSSGLLHSVVPLKIVAMDWPLALAAGPGPGYHGISNFVDLNSFYPNALLDYNCGTRTYDTASGYNHQGIDYFTWPFGWYKMDHEQVAIVAAEPGMIIGKDDGNADRSCSTSGGNWNAVYVRHADGSEAWYGHMKNGSLTAKGVGSTVAAGEYLGIVGSSGNSTGPHLHLEIRDNLDNVVEPYSGPCNVGTSWWSSQRPYYDSAVNMVATHSDVPEFPTCPTREIPHFSDTFEPGATLYTAAYYRDQRSNQISQYTIFRPDNTVWQSWTHSFTSPSHYAASWWYWTWSLPAGPEGMWEFQVTYNGETTTHNFEVTVPIFTDGFESGNLSAWSTFQ